jgi:diphthamide biosynthesis enzyme Dph1/Dph2-like protein
MPLTVHTPVCRQTSALYRLTHSTVQVYLLAETGNTGKAVDVIGAAHANAEAVIQFGDASLVPVEGVLVHHVLPKKRLEVDRLVDEIKQLLTCLSKDVVVVLLDGPFMHMRQALLDSLKVRDCAPTNKPLAAS